MSYCLKTILIVFLFLNLCLCRQTAFAWQQEHSSNQDSLSDYTSDENTDNEEDWSETAEEDASEEYYNYNEEHFDKVTDRPTRIKRALNEKEWNRITKNPDFNYEKYKNQSNQVKEQEKDDSESWFEKMMRAIASFFGSKAGRWFTMGFVVIIILILIIRFFQLKGNVFFSKKDKKINRPDDETSEDYVPENWETEINAAAKAGNYRLALRHCYRYLLNTMQENGLIQFQVAKTNYQYVYELSGTEHYNTFMKLTRDYEYAWYGGFEIGADFYEDYYETAKRMQQQLKH